MNKHGLKAVVATSPINVYYFSEFDCWMYRGFKEYFHNPGAPDLLMQAYAVLPSEGEPALIVKADTAGFARDLPVKDLQTYSAPSDSEVEESGPSYALESSLKNRGITSGTVGYEPANISEIVLQRTKKALPNVRFVDCSNLIRLVRMVKTQEELECIKRAAEISEKAILQVLSEMRPGATLGEIMATYSSVAAKEGAYFDHFIYDPRGNGITSDPQLRIQENGFFFFDYGVIFQQYYSDSGKTIFLGGMSKEQSDTFNSLWQTVEETKDEIRPGTLPSSILDMLAKKLAHRGITKIYAHGHAIGLEPREYPVIMRSDYGKFSDGIVSETTDLPLEAGMTFNLETPYDLPGVGSFQVEKTFVVKKDSTQEFFVQKEGVPFILEN
jgi:Xaa-Pro aminopeptidase